MGSIRPDPNLLKKYPNAVTVTQLQEKDRFLGALLGAAAGEALGLAAEGRSEVPPEVGDAASNSRSAHGAPRSVGGCVALATAVALLVRADKDGEEAVTRAALAGGEASDEVRAAIERGASKRPEQIDPGTGFVLSTLELGFSALCSAASFEQGV